MLIDTTPCIKAAELFEGISSDVSPEWRETFMDLAFRLKGLPVPFETEEFQESLRALIGEELIWQSLLLTVIGNNQNLEELNLPEVDMHTRQLLLNSGIIGAVNNQHTEAQFAKLGESIGEIGVLIMEGR